MANKTREAMNILSEECAEVIVEISKCHRFGFEGVKPGKERTNRDCLAQELGDVLAMVDILLDHSIITQEQLDQAKKNKIEKLKVWSGIFKD